MSKISERSWQTLSIGVAIAIGTLPIAGTMVAINSGSISYKTEQAEINLQGKGRMLTAIDANNNQKLVAEFEQLKLDVADLARVAQQKKVAPLLAPQLENVEQKVEQSQLRLNDAIESQKEVKNFIEINE